MLARCTPCGKRPLAGSEANEETWSAAYDRIMADTRPELRGDLEPGLPTGQRRVLAALAAGQSLYSTAAPSAAAPVGGATKGALDALIDRGEVDGTRRIIDPLLAAWIRAGTPGA